VDLRPDAEDCLQPTRILPGSVRRAQRSALMMVFRDHEVSTRVPAVRADGARWRESGHLRRRCLAGCRCCGRCDDGLHLSSWPQTRPCHWLTLSLLRWASGSGMCWRPRSAATLVADTFLRRVRVRLEPAGSCSPATPRLINPLRSQRMVVGGQQ